MRWNKRISGSIFSERVTKGDLQNGNVKESYKTNNYVWIYNSQLVVHSICQQTKGKILNVTEII